MNMNKLKRVRMLYDSILQKYPIVIHAAQTGTLLASGDLIAQLLVERRKVSHIEIRRTGKFFGIGLLVVVC